MKFCIIFCVSMASIFCNAQKASFLQVKYLKGKTVIHTNAVKNISGVQPTGVELSLAKQFALKKINLCNGWSLQYSNYNSAILGYGIIASRFIEPNFIISKKIHFGFKTSIGVSYLSNPNNGIQHTNNNNYALHINPYLHFGAGLNIAVSNKVALFAQANFHHISNGNIKQPNLGLNWTTTAIGAGYYFNKTNYYNKIVSKTNSSKIVKQIMLQFVPKQGYFAKWQAQRMYMLGVGMQVNKPFANNHAITLGAEINYNNFLQDAGTQSVKSPWVFGVQGGHVFLLGKVNFSQQIGYAIFNKIQFLPSLYHRWALSYYLNKKILIGACLKANSDNADFFDTRIIFQW